MFRRLCGFFLALSLTAAPALAAAKEEPRAQRVTFKDGRATLKGRIEGRQSVDYVFPAGAGESLRVSLKTSNPAAYFNLRAPGETMAAFFVGHVAGNSYSGVAPISGDYTARVYLMRSAARRGEVANYALKIAVGESRSDHEGPDFADALTGGPDYWEVVGVPAGDRLAVRETPSPRGKLVTQVGNTAVMKNLGCRNQRGQRWCQVGDGAGRRGWVNGIYLREAAWPPGQ